LSELTLAEFRAQLIALRAEHAGDGDRLVLLDRLDAWGRELAAGLPDA
jgi:exodeoxyribonuclease I